MARYERVAQIVGRLSVARAPLSLEQLCVELGASTATVKRLVRFMREELRIPVEFDRAAGGYRMDPQAAAPSPVPRIGLSAEQALLVLAGCELLGQLAPGLLTEEPALLRDRIGPLPAELEARRGAVGQCLRARLPQRRAHAPSVLRDVALGLLSARRLRIHCRATQGETALERTVSPQRLTFYRDNWYLASWCHASHELRIDALDTIEAATATPIPADLLARARLEAALDSAYGLSAGEAREVAVLRLGGAGAARASDEAWHPRQRLVRHADGSVTLYVPYRETAELCGDILRWGATVEVLAPPALRSEVAAALADAIRHYD